jgi:hypothetical protein
MATAHQPRRRAASGTIDAIGASENRRLYPRRRTTFPATYRSVGRNPLPAYGLDVGGGGVQLLTREPLPAQVPMRLTIDAMFDGRRLTVDAISCWSASTVEKDGRRYRHGLKLLTIKDADWEFLMALSAEAGNGRFATGLLTAGQLSAMLSPAKLHAVADALKGLERLTYAPGHRLPLIEYVFDGYSMRAGVPYYRFTVRSRVTVEHRTRECKSSVLVAIETDAVRVLD